MDRDSETHVLHITSSHLPFDVRIFQKECRSLVGAGFKVTLIVPCIEDSVVDGVRIKALPRASSLAGRVTLTVWKAFRESLRQSADIIHLHDPELLPAGVLLALCGRNVIYDCHENVADDFLNREWIPKGLRKSFSWLADLAERFAVRRLSGVVAADGQLCIRFRDTSVPVVKVENYPILKEFPDSLFDNTSRFSSGTGVNFGGVSAWRAIEPLIHAVGMLPEELRFRLILGGDRDSDELLQRIALLPGWKRVDYRGPVRRKEMLETLSCSALAIVLYKYKDQGDDLDIRSNRLFEALAAGLPVITPNFSRWRQFIERTGCGLSVDPDEPGQIAKALQFLIEHPAKAEEMGRRGAEAVRRQFNWHNEERKLIEFYIQLIGRHEGWSSQTL